LTRLTESPERRNPDCMTGDRIPSLFMQIADELRARGVLITCLAGEWRVNFRGGTGATAYVTDDLQDAFDHGRAMALAAVAAPPEAPQPRRKWRRPMTAKAARRALIKKHNRRRRARALREQRTEG
jgi:hypothetical protein